MVTITFWNQVNSKDIIGLWHYRHGCGRGLAASIALFIKVDYESAKAKAYYPTEIYLYDPLTTITLAKKELCSKVMKRQLLRNYCRDTTHV